MSDREDPLTAAQLRTRIGRGSTPRGDIEGEFDVTVSAAVLEWLIGADDVATGELRTALAEREFVDSTGIRTDAGRWARTMLRPSETPGIRVDIVNSVGGRVVLAGVDGRRALVAGQEGPDEWGFSVIGSSAVPNLLVHHVSVSPSQVLDEIDRTITADELTAALESTQAVEPPADASLVEALLCVPWTRITIRTTDGAGVDIAQVPSWGLFELMPLDSTIALVPIASDEFYDMLIEVVAAAAGVGAPAPQS